MYDPKFVRSKTFPPRRYIRGNASPSFQPLTTVHRNCLGGPINTEIYWEDAKCEIVNISPLREITFKISGLPSSEKGILMLSNASPDLIVSILDESSTKENPLVLLDLMNGDEFSVRTSGSGTFLISLFSQLMEVQFQRIYAIVDTHASKQAYATTIQKAKNRKLFPEMIAYTNDATKKIQACHLSESGFSGFGKDARIFFTYWNIVHDILRTKQFVDVQLFTRQTHRFACTHTKFVARCVKYYRSKYKHTSKAPEPVVDAFKVLHDFGF